MNTTFTFKGFKAEFKDGKKEKGKIEIGEITMKVEDMNMKEYLDFYLKLPELARQFSDVIIEHERKEHELHKEIRASYDSEMTTSEMHDEVEKATSHWNADEEKPFSFSKSSAHVNSDNDDDDWGI